MKSSYNYQHLVERFCDNDLSSIERKAIERDRQTDTQLDYMIKTEIKIREAIRQTQLPELNLSQEFINDFWEQFEKRIENL